MKIPAVVSFADKTFEPYGEVRGLDKFYIDKDLELANAEIVLTDPRAISPEQRRKWFALIRDISLYTGYEVDYLHTLFKVMFSVYTGGDNVSLSATDMTTAGALIDFLLEWAFDNGVPLAEDTGRMFQGEEAWTRHCLKNKICVVCGQKAEVHHYDQIGTGRNRKRVDDSEYLKLPLCRSHHTEAHAMGKKSFIKKYHVKPVRG